MHCRNSLLVLQAVDSSIFCLQLSLFLADVFHFCIWRKSMVSLLTASSYSPLGFFTGLLPPDHTPIVLLGIWGSSILTMIPAHCIPFRCKSVESTKSSYKLYIRNSIHKINSRNYEYTIGLYAWLITIRKFIWQTSSDRGHLESIVCSLVDRY